MHLINNHAAGANSGIRSISAYHELISANPCSNLCNKSSDADPYPIPDCQYRGFKAVPPIPVDEAHPPDAAIPNPAVAIPEVICEGKPHPLAPTGPASKGTTVILPQALIIEVE